MKVHHVVAAILSAFENGAYREFDIRGVDISLNGNFLAKLESLLFGQGLADGGSSSLVLECL